MRMNDVRRLLDDLGIDYCVSRVADQREFYQQKGFLRAKDENAFQLICIVNPNHSKNIEIVFRSDDENPEFYDLEFGGYWYELFDCTEECVSAELKKEMIKIMAGETYIIFARDAKSGAWFYDQIFYDSDNAEENCMDEFQKYLAKIRAPKSWWRKLIRRTDIYEIYNWNTYERIVK